MRIVHLLAGAGGMYCGSCLHGNTLAAALGQSGEDVLLIPLYTPLRTDEQDVSTDRVAFGAVNVFLQQHSALFRHTPRFVDWLFNRPGLVRWLGRMGRSHRPEHLGRLTVSMLQGEEGRQRKELDKLIRWLRAEVRPELVHLSNVMLVGTARRLTKELDVPVVCTLSGEDVFLEKLPEPYYSRSRDLLRRKCADLAALVAMNGYFADFMADYLAVPRGRIHVIRPGLNLSGYGEPRTAQRPSRTGEQPLTIGYLARICPEKGLHLLVEALKLLAKEEVLPAVHLRAAGYLDPVDRPYLAQIQSQVDDAGLAERFRYVGELDRAAKIAFLQSLDIMSVPTVYRESKGLSILEAWAAGVPVVVPDHGAFPELLADTGGGLLCRPNDPSSLAAALRRMIEEPALAAGCSRQARIAVFDRYSALHMAGQTIKLYRRTVRGDRAENA